jgi:phosphonate transport system substrate-binding protein
MIFRALAIILLGILAVFLITGEREEKGTAIDLGDRVPDSVLEGSAASAAGAEVITFGFDLRNSPEEDARQYIPFLDYLERTTGLTFRLRFTPRDGQLAEELGTGVVDMAAVGAVSFLKAQNVHGAKPLVRGLNMKGTTDYQSLIVVSPESEIRSIKDLRGRKLAFGSIDSTQGHIIPRIALHEAGISLAGLSGYEFTGSHLNCASAVIDGRADACGMQDTMGRSLAAEGKVRIIYTSRRFPSSGIAANKNLPPDVFSKVQKALVEFDPKGRHRDGLYEWDRTEMPKGFIAASPADYLELLEQVSALGFLE